MSYCTFRGVGSLPALPETKVDEMKAFLLKLALPHFVNSRVEFEDIWKWCVESIGQSCKSLCKLRLAGLNLQ